MTEHGSVPGQPWPNNYLAFSLFVTRPAVKLLFHYSKRPRIFLKMYLGLCECVCLLFVYLKGSNITKRHRLCSVCVAAPDSSVHSSRHSPTCSTMVYAQALTYVLHWWGYGLLVYLAQWGALTGARREARDWGEGSIYSHGSLSLRSCQVAASPEWKPLLLHILPLPWSLGAQGGIANQLLA